MEAHIKEHAAWFHRFEALWTPTVLIFAPEGMERFRIEGYLPNDEFRAHLELGLARVAFMKKKLADAEEHYKQVLQNYPETTASAEALYWAGVCRYQATHDPSHLGQTAQQFKQKHQRTVWAKKASVWGG